jgi:ferredoxin
MTTTIYYFTGTGNSLSIARGIAAELDESELIFMPNLWKDEKIVATSERVGFIFPMYYFGLPQIVYEFLEKIHLDTAQYLFAGVDRDGTMDGVAYVQIEQLFSEKGKQLNAGWFLQMPNNDIPVDDLNSKEEIKEKLRQIKPQIEEIAEYIREKKNHPPPLPKKRIKSVEKTNTIFRKGVFTMDQNYYADENCSSCGICAQVCPVENIIMENTKPLWNNQCQMCVACINFCPEEAIQYADKTQERGRYHHPEITVQEIIDQKH